MDVGQSTIQGILCKGVLVLVQNLFESLAIRFIVEGIRLAQDLGSVLRTSLNTSEMI